MKCGWERQQKGGFTVIELMVSGAVLALLLFAFAPALQQARVEARSKVCQGNLAQIGRATSVYSESSNDLLPGNQHSEPSWILSLAVYAGTNSYRCPEALLTDQPTRKSTIALNDFLSRRPYGARQVDYSRRSSIPAPKETLMFAEVERPYRDYDHFHFADAKEHGYGIEPFGEQVAVEQHESDANYLFVDGHVDGLNWSAGVKPKLRSAGSKFVHPGGESGHSWATR